MCAKNSIEYKTHKICQGTIKKVVNLDHIKKIPPKIKRYRVEQV